MLFPITKREKEGKNVSNEFEEFSIRWQNSNPLPEESIFPLFPVAHSQWINFYWNLINSPNFIWTNTSRAGTWRVRLPSDLWPQENSFHFNVRLSTRMISLLNKLLMKMWRDGGGLITTASSSPSFLIPWENNCCFAAISTDFVPVDCWRGHVGEAKERQPPGVTSRHF